MNRPTPARARRGAICPCLAARTAGNAAKSGLCKHLSTGNQAVCELTSAQPDVHATFNAATALHVTVRTANKACEGNAALAGTFPGQLALKARAPATVCKVNVASYVSRLNAITQAAGNNKCVAALTAAKQAHKLDMPTFTHYKELCTDNACP